MEQEICHYCNATPHNNTSNIGQQVFNDKTISIVKLNPFNTSLLSTSTCNIPDKGSNDYQVTVKINFCPMCGRKLRS